MILIPSSQEEIYLQFPSRQVEKIRKTDSLALGSSFRSYRESKHGDRVGKGVHEHALGRVDLRRRF